MLQSRWQPIQETNRYLRWIPSISDVKGAGIWSIELSIPRWRWGITRFHRLLPAVSQLAAAAISWYNVPDVMMPHWGDIFTLNNAALIFSENSIVWAQFYLKVCPITRMSLNVTGVMTILLMISSFCGQHARWHHPFPQSQKTPSYPASTILPGTLLGNVNDLRLWRAIVWQFWPCFVLQLPEYIRGSNLLRKLANIYPKLLKCFLSFLNVGINPFTLHYSYMYRD